MLFLFDIDGTLLKAGKAPRNAFIKTIKDIFDIDVENKNISFVGKTDLSILIENTKPHITEKEVLTKKDEFFETFYYNFKKIYSKVDDKFLLPYVKETLYFLINKREIIGLLTGNSKKTAYEKLLPFGIKDYFKIGAFGDEEIRRENLISLAHKRAEIFFNRTIKREEIIIVGDSIPDIYTAKVYNVKAIIVLTGWTDRKTIEENSPDYIIENFFHFKKLYNSKIFYPVHG